MVGAIAMAVEMVAVEAATTATAETAATTTAMTAVEVVVVATVAAVVVVAAATMIGEVEVAAAAATTVTIKIETLLLMATGTDLTAITRVGEMTAEEAGIIAIAVAAVAAGTKTRAHGVTTREAGVTTRAHGETKDGATKDGETRATTRDGEISGGTTTRVRQAAPANHQHGARAMATTGGNSNSKAGANKLLQLRRPSKHPPTLNLRQASRAGMVRGTTTSHNKSSLITEK